MAETVLTTGMIAQEIGMTEGLVEMLEFLRRYPPAMRFTVYRDDAPEDVEPPEVSYEPISDGYRIIGFLTILD